MGKDDKDATDVLCDPSTSGYTFFSCGKYRCCPDVLHGWNSCAKRFTKYIALVESVDLAII